MAAITPLRLTRILGAEDAGFDMVIDARAPSEFAQDHLPGAVSLPVLSDAERAQVGTIYKQVAPFDARKIGAALVARNVADHIAGPLANMPGGWRPLVYCWRGGQRSGAFATILAQVGWRVAQLEGGYKAWRALVVQRLQEQGFGAALRVIDGNTGSAKTAILAQLAARGQQVIDLEGMANHRGSIFGAQGAQPAQRLFESRLASAIERLDPARPVLIEAESSRIGECSLPRAVWADLCAAPRLRLEVPVAQRAAYSLRDYADIGADKAALQALIARLAPFHPAGRIAQWQEQVADGALYEVAFGLMRDHYDPRYAKHRARYGAQEKAVLALDSLDDLAQAADRVEEALEQLARGAQGPDSSC